MVKLELLHGIDYLAKLPGNESVRVHWDPSTSHFYIVDSSEKIPVPKTAYIICAGQPLKFFNLLHNLLSRESLSKIRTTK